MPIQSTTPVENNGNTYPYFMVNLAISPLVKPTDVGGSVAMRLTPYRVLEDGSSETYEEGSIPLVYMDVFQETDVALLTAVQTIMGSIQQFIIDKGI